MMAWISSRPTPGQAKIVSVMIVPVRTAPNCRPMIVTTGIRLLRSAWRTTVAGPREAARARGDNVQLAQLVDEARARHARQNRRERRAERDRRQHQVAPRPGAADGQPAERDAEQHREQRTQPEIRHRHAGQRKRHGGLIDRAPAEQRREHAERHRKEDRQAHRGDGELRRVPQALANLAARPACSSGTTCPGRRARDPPGSARTARGAARRDPGAPADRRRQLSMRTRPASPAPGRPARDGSSRKTSVATPSSTGTVIARRRSR